MEKKQKLWTRDFIMLTAINFFVSFNFFSINNTMPLYAMSAFKLNESKAGFVVGIFSFGILVARFFAGKYAERIGYKKTLIFSTTAITIVTSGYLFATTVPFLCAVRFFNGFFIGTALNTALTLAGSSVPRERSGEGLGYFSLGQVLATALGPSFGVSLAMNERFTALFLLCTSVVGVGILFSILIRIKPNESQSDELDSSENESTKSKGGIIEPKVIPIAIIAALLIGTSVGINSFLAPFAKDIGIANAVVFYFPMNAVSMLISRPFIGKLYDRKGANIVIFPSLIIYSIGMLIANQAQYGYSLLILAVLVGVGLGGFSSTSLALVMKLVPIHRLNMANATYYIFVDTAASIGPVVIGLIIPIFGFRGMFIFAFIVILLCIPTYFLIYGKKLMRENATNK